MLPEVKGKKEAELEQPGYIVISGRVNRRYLMEKIYGYDGKKKSNE